MSNPSHENRSVCGGPGRGASTGDLARAFLLLGASNLAMSIDAVRDRLAHAASGAARPRIFHAAGPGRAYCAEGGFLWVHYAPLLRCPEVEKARAALAEGAELTILLTDLGNDIPHGVEPGVLCNAIDAFVGRFDHHGVRFVATSIATRMPAQIGPRKYRLLRPLLYPGSTVDYETAAAAVSYINAWLDRRAGARFTVVETRTSNPPAHHRPGALRSTGGEGGSGPGPDSLAPLAWDGIHYRYRARAAVWTGFTDALIEAAGLPRCPVPVPAAAIRSARWAFWARVLSDLRR